MREELDDTLLFSQSGLPGAYRCLQLLYDNNNNIGKYSTECKLRRSIYSHQGSVVNMTLLLIIELCTPAANTLKDKKASSTLLLGK